VQGGRAAQPLHQLHTWVAFCNSKSWSTRKALVWKSSALVDISNWMLSKWWRPAAGANDRRRRAQLGVDRPMGPL